jgi:hypothetical protein
MCGAYLVAVAWLGGDPGVFMQSIRDFAACRRTCYMGLIKAAVFGFLDLGDLVPPRLLRERRRARRRPRDHAGRRRELRDDPDRELHPHAGLLGGEL